MTFIVGFVSASITGAISKSVGGSFWEGFAKGFITGSLTTAFVLFGVPPSLASAAASGIAAAVLEAWNWYMNPEQFSPWEATTRIVAAIAIGLIGGHVFGKHLEGLAVNAPALGKALAEGPVASNVGLISAEIGKIGVKGITMSTVTTAVNLTTMLVFAIHDKGREIVEGYVDRLEGVDGM